MARKNQSRYVNSIQCPVDLDSLLMSPECSPEYIEENMNVGSDIFWDAIRTSTMSYWLLKLDVMEQFSKDMRSKIFCALPVFSRMSRVYFYIQMMNTNIHETLDEELHRWESENPQDSQKDANISLFNPMNMLSNNLKEWDIQILNGKLTLRKFLLDRIRDFLASGKKDDVDFSHSLFLPELLSPKFFKDLSEAEHIVILGNLDKYFRFVEKFNKTGINRATYMRHELNPPQNLLKHIFSGECPYTNRVKMIAWKQFFKETETIFGSANNQAGVFKVMDVDKLNELSESLSNDKLAPREFTIADIERWLTAAEGVFEAFELDCTLHNLNAPDYFIPILCSRAFYKMADGLVNFQDDSRRDALFKQLSSVMLSNR